MDLESINFVCSDSGSTINKPKGRLSFMLGSAVPNSSVLIVKILKAFLPFCE